MTGDSAIDGERGIARCWCFKRVRLPHRVWGGGLPPEKPMTTDTDNASETEINWNSYILPPNVAWVWSECDECGHQIATSVTAEMTRMPSIYCGECMHGPAVSSYAYEFIGGEVAYDPKYDGEPIPTERDDGGW